MEIVAPWTTWSLVVGLIGVVMLFIFGMPFTVRTKGAISIITEGTDEGAVRREGLFSLLSYIGLALTVGGVVVQILIANRIVGP